MTGKLFFDKKSGDALKKCITYISAVQNPLQIHLSSREGFTEDDIRVASEYCRGRKVILVISKLIAPYNIYVVEEDDSKSIFEKTSGQNPVL